MFSFEGSTFKNLYLENFTQKNKKSIVLMRCYGNEQKCSTSNQCELMKELTRTRNVDVLSKLNSQATKGIRRMPRRHQPMKDAVSCEKLRGTAYKY